MGLIKSKFFPFIKNTKKKLFAFFSFFYPRKKADLSDRQTDFDKKMVYSLSKSKIPTFKQIKYISRFLTRKEVWLIRVFFLVIILNLSFLGIRFYNNHLKIVPVLGGDYTEALVGAPKHVNPLYASINDVDGDLSHLIFSSLFKYDSQGNLIKDLANDHEVSEDGKEYIITLREGAKWHNGKALKADDVVFTFKAIKNPAYDSTLRSSFVGVNIDKVNEKQVRFTLSEKYAPFLDLLTFGILPQELWSRIPVDAASLAELNLKPIGSGPYKFKSLVKDKIGNIKLYNLEVNEDYYGVTPYIKNLTFKFFPTFTETINALNNNEVDGLSYLPYTNKEDLVAKDSLNIHELEIPQIDSIFFDQDAVNPGLDSLDVRKALAYATPKEKIVSEVLSGNGQVASGPILASSFAFSESGQKYAFDMEKAESLFKEAGWEKFEIKKEEIEKLKAKKQAFMASSTATSSDEEQENKDEEDEKEALTTEEEIKIALGVGTWRRKEAEDGNEYLKVDITTINEDRNIRVADKIKEHWEKAGVKTNIILVPINQIQTEVIDPRNYEALLFSQFVGSDPDSYAFWHSSQIGKGGLNLSNYANEEVDEMLEEGRFTLGKEKRKEKYEKFQELISKDVPAIFLYSPYYIYVQSKNIKGFKTDNIIHPSDRFTDISSWYIKTGKRLVW